MKYIPTCPDCGHEVAVHVYVCLHEFQEPGSTVTSCTCKRTDLVYIASRGEGLIEMAAHFKLMTEAVAAMVKHAPRYFEGIEREYGLLWKALEKTGGWERSSFQESAIHTLRNYGRARGVSPTELAVLDSEFLTRVWNGKAPPLVP